MYSSSSSSSQHQQSSTPNNNNNNNNNNTMCPPSTTHHNNNNTNTNTNLTRYGSAPSSFLSNAVESVTGLTHHHHNYHTYSGGDSLNAPESTHSKGARGESTHSKSTLTLLRSSYGGNLSNDGMNPSTSSHLTRTSSSPAGLLNHLASDVIGFSVSKGMENYNSQGVSISGHKLSRLGSQLSFTKQDHHSLSQISEVNECAYQGIGSSHENDHKRSAPSQSRSTSGFSLSAWDDSNNNYVFSTSSSSKRAKHIDDDILNGLAGIDSQYGDSQAALEMATMDRLLQIPQDSVPCKIRAKRGCATHPRSIAERERRTRISRKLKKLQDLVPNMDKQTSYSDMLDLAVQHIKGLQIQIQKLKKDVESCTCGCKQNIQ